MQLTREFRFFLRGGPLPGQTDNAWSGWNCGSTIAPWLALRIAVAGQVDSASGYLVDIRTLDRAARQAIDGLPAEVLSWTWLRLAEVLFEAISPRLPTRISLQHVDLVLSPHHKVTVHTGTPSMITWNQQFEFSAAHRLHCPDRDDDWNARTFGKCNNPAGHGHNYVVEVTAEISEAREPHPFQPAEFERAVRLAVIDRLDHKNLNIDVPELAGSIPSVENIARLIWKWLDGRLPGGTLRNVRLYETPKTWADVSAG